ncbi:hypothetical protein RFI_04283 [Reticulomyxa filosa]|uniref:Uncharacterized protein n=1 Tax=Reticulomyxa filosa TaxID=46433 RepID=X6P3X8_RETFI|nr:hypothetical protein RFI_04283 [Reticulomyxa filosa]|eukprot:ETO32833.1 hypothetical protein RFI_04283 [Reticulomyxa filosa]
MNELMKKYQQVKILIEEAQKKEGEEEKEKLERLLLETALDMLEKLPATKRKECKEDDSRHTGDDSTTESSTKSISPSSSTTCVVMKVFEMPALQKLKLSIMDGISINKKLLTGTSWKQLFKICQQYLCDENEEIGSRVNKLFIESLHHLVKEMKDFIKTMESIEAKYFSSPFSLSSNRHNEMMGLMNKLHAFYQQFGSLELFEEIKRLCSNYIEHIKTRLQRNNVQLNEWFTFNDEQGCAYRMMTQSLSFISFITARDIVAKYSFDATPMASWLPKLHHWRKQLTEASNKASVHGTSSSSFSFSSVTLDHNSNLMLSSSASFNKESLVEMIHPDVTTTDADVSSLLFQWLKSYVNFFIECGNNEHFQQNTVTFNLKKKNDFLFSHRLQCLEQVNVFLKQFQSDYSGELKHWQEKDKSAGRHGVPPDGEKKWRHWAKQILPLLQGLCQAMMNQFGLFIDSDKGRENRQKYLRILKEIFRDGFGVNSASTVCESFAHCLFLEGMLWDPQHSSIVGNALFREDLYLQMPSDNVHQYANAHTKWKPFQQLSRYPTYVDRNDTIFLMCKIGSFVAMLLGRIHIRLATLPVYDSCVYFILFFFKFFFLLKKKKKRNNNNRGVHFTIQRRQTCGISLLESAIAE